MTPLNVQAPEKPVRRDDGFVEVVSVFKTIQGEGPWSGTPSVFVRLAGCNLFCSLCDTDYTSGRRLLGLDSVRDEVVRLAGNARLVVVTGGEPFRQRLGPLAYLLLSEGLDVQVETNGTIHEPGFPYKSPGVTVVVSPKTRAINPQVDVLADAFKYVVEAGWTCPEDGLPLRVLGDECRVARPAHLPARKRRSEVFVQPCDNKDPEANRMNVNAAVASCMTFGYRLSLQTHKIVGLD